MTEPRDMHREPQAEAASDLEVSPELIKDLDVPGDHAGNIAGAGGCSETIYSLAPGRGQ
jgi:hypothetical protein